eukprot:TRINITY_DN5769_c0_g1_i2.p1 TRINITY_DN5769_c0_g1~~TRINITY_DN5769_c0_g1_i2.p1  ORF type:complete len:328 (+),score=40.79 TRINITY_DN5769_c0_g1_i2:52-984(+)
MSSADDMVQMSVIVMCSLSIAGAAFIMFSFAIFIDLRQVQSRRLLFMLALCDLFVAIAYLLPSTSYMCKVQAAVNIYFNQASFLWTDCIALYVYASHKYGPKIANKFVPYFHAASWLLPAASTVAVAVNSAWGPDNKATTAYWCWIDGDIEHAWEWRIIAGKAIEWSTIIFISIMYLCVYIDVHAKVEQSPGAQLLLKNTSTNWRATEKKLLAIPVLFVFLRLGGTARTILTMANSSSDMLWIRILQALGDSAQGFVNGLLFGVFTDKVLRSYKRLFRELRDRLRSGRYSYVDYDVDPVNHKSYDTINPS